MSFRAVIDELCLLASLESCLKTQTTGIHGWTGYHYITIIAIDYGKKIWQTNYAALVISEFHF